MTHLKGKIGNKLEDDAVSAISKSTWAVIGTLALTIGGIVIGRPEAGFIVAGLLLLFGFGLWLGRWGTRRRYQQNEIKHSERAVIQGNLFVIGAFYGMGASWFNVTETLNLAIREGASKIDVNNNLVPLKELSRMIALPQRLVFTYVYQEHIYAEEAKQNDKLNIKSDKIEVISTANAGMSNPQGQQSAPTWKREKVSNVYWLGADLMTTLCRLDKDTPTEIIRNLHHINAHANALELDQITLRKTQKLFKDASECKDWNSEQERKKIGTELQELYNILQHIMDTADPNYRPDQI